MATTQKAAAPAAKKSQGFTGIRGAFWIIVVCFIAAICIFTLVLGDKSNFQGGDVNNHPLNMLGTIYKGGYVVPIIHTLQLSVLCLSVERWLAMKTAFGKGNLTKFVANIKGFFEG
jgi:biopolymer transport protein ExbB